MFFFVFFFISTVCYEISRFLTYFFRKKDLPLWWKIVRPILFSLGLLALYTIGLVDHYIENVLFQFRIDGMKAVRVIASSNQRPDKGIEKMYGFDCERFQYDDETFDLWRWQYYEYDKLGM